MSDGRPPILTSRTGSWPRFRQSLQRTWPPSLARSEVFERRAPPCSVSSRQPDRPCWPSPVSAGTDVSRWTAGFTTFRVVCLLASRGSVRRHAEPCPCTADRPDSIVKLWDLQKANPDSDEVSARLKHLGPHPLSR